MGADRLTVGKELRLKQQYFWTAASLADMLRRFKNLGKPISEFADCAFIYTPVSFSHLCMYMNR
jgi:glucan phosphorylase